MQSDPFGYHIPIKIEALPLGSFSRRRFGIAYASLGQKTLAPGVKISEGNGGLPKVDLSSPNGGLISFICFNMMIWGLGFCFVGNSLRNHGLKMAPLCVWRERCCQIGTFLVQCEQFRSKLNEFLG